MRVKSDFSFIWSHRGRTQGLILESYKILGIKSELVECKTSALPAVLHSQAWVFLKYSFLFASWSNSTVDTEEPLLPSPLAPRPSFLSLAAQPCSSPLGCLINKFPQLSTSMPWGIVYQRIGFRSTLNRSLLRFPKELNAQLCYSMNDPFKCSENPPNRTEQVQFLQPRNLK